MKKIGLHTSVEVLKCNYLLPFLYCTGIDGRIPGVPYRQFIETGAENKNNDTLYATSIKLKAAAIFVYGLKVLNNYRLYNLIFFFTSNTNFVMEGSVLYIVLLQYIDNLQ